MHENGTISSELIDKHFTKSDRVELAKIIAFVDSAVLSKVENENININKAYHHYLDSMFTLKVDGQEFDSLVFDEEKKFVFLFSLDSSLFNKIWVKSLSKRVKTRDTILIPPDRLISISFYINSEFFVLLKDFGINNEYYAGMIDDMESAGGLSPTVVASYLLFHRAFDFTNPDNKLWAAMFLMTLEESLEIRVQRYLTKK